MSQAGFDFLPRPQPRGPSFPLPFPFPDFPFPPIPIPLPFFPDPQGPGRPTLPQPQPRPSPGPGPGPSFGTCRNTRGTSMPPSVSENGQLCCPSGWHLSTTTDPCSGNRNSCCVKNRKMNVMNMRAHSRAVRRIRGNARAQQRARKAVALAAREMGAIPRRSRSKPCK